MPLRFRRIGLPSGRRTRSRTGGRHRHVARRERQAGRPRRGVRRRGSRGRRTLLLRALAARADRILHGAGRRPAAAALPLQHAVAREGVPRTRDRQDAGRPPEHHRPQGQLGQHDLFPDAALPPGRPRGFRPLRGSRGADGRKRRDGGRRRRERRRQHLPRTLRADVLRRLQPRREHDARAATEDHADQHVALHRRQIRIELPERRQMCTLAAGYL